MDELKKEYPKMPVIVCEVMPSSEKQHLEDLNVLIKKDVKHKRNV